MAYAKSRRGRWSLACLGLACLGTGAWLLLAAEPEPRGRGAGGAGGAREAGAQASSEGRGKSRALALLEAADAAAGRTRVAAGGRVSLDFDRVRGEPALRLALDLSDEARGKGDRVTRVVSQDGRRLDTHASAIAGAGAGLQLEIDSAFFATSGRYLVEVETEEGHPLRLRRYVLELE